MKHRKYGKSVLKALILGSLVTVSVPGLAGAETTKPADEMVTEIGPVTVDGSITTSETATAVGKEARFRLLRLKEAEIHTA